MSTRADISTINQFLTPPYTYEGEITDGFLEIICIRSQSAPMGPIERSKIDLLKKKYWQYHPQIDMGLECHKTKHCRTPAQPKSGYSNCSLRVRGDEHASRCPRGRGQVQPPELIIEHLSWSLDNRLDLLPDNKPTKTACFVQ